LRKESLLKLFSIQSEDNIDTRAVLEALKDLVNKSNIYIKENDSMKRRVVRSFLMCKKSRDELCPKYDNSNFLFF